MNKTLEECVVDIIKTDRLDEGIVDIFKKIFDKNFISKSDMKIIIDGYNKNQVLRKKFEESAVKFTEGTKLVQILQKNNWTDKGNDTYIESQIVKRNGKFNCDIFVFHNDFYLMDTRWGQYSTADYYSWTRWAKEMIPNIIPKEFKFIRAKEEYLRFSLNI